MHFKNSYVEHLSAKSKIETSSNLTFKSSWHSLIKKIKCFIYFHLHVFLKVYLNVYTSRNFVLCNQKKND